MRAFIEKKLKAIEETYITAPERIQSDYGRERADIAGYKGRELLELLQNAEDELIESLPKKIYISFLDNEFTISNYGSPFTTKGVTSLIYSNLSPKRKLKEKIGNKGTGFRSILGWAEQIYIRSENLSIRFSQEDAQNNFQRIVEKIPDYPDNEVAVLVFPTWVDVDESTDYTTTVSIKIKNNDEIKQDIFKQLNEISAETLIFLKKTEELEIKTHDKTISLSKKINADEIHIDEIIELSGEEKKHSTYKWQIRSNQGKMKIDDGQGVKKDKHYEVIIAVPKDGTIIKKKNIYCYFPTDVEFPFPVLLHADFELSQDRNHLVKGNKANVKMLEKAFTMMIELALANTSRNVSYNSLHILIPSNDIPYIFCGYSFKEYVLNQVFKAKLFPTVNNEYITFENAVLLEHLPQVLKGEFFGEMLAFTNDANVKKYLSRLYKSNSENIPWNQEFPIYEASELIEKINLWAKANEDKISNGNKAEQDSIIHAHARCAIAFIKDYPTCLEAPQVFFNTDMKLSTATDTIYVGSSNLSTPPNFLQFQFIHEKMRGYISSCNEFREIRTIADKFSTFKVREYRAAGIIDSINRAIKLELDESNNEQAFEKTILSLKWLWANQHILDSTDKVDIYLPTRAKTVERSKYLYFGTEYGKDLCENLFARIENKEEKFVYNIAQYVDIGTNENDNKIIFLENFGVNSYPRKIKSNTLLDLTLHKNLSYKNKLLAMLNYPFDAQKGYVFRDATSMSKCSTLRCEVDSILELSEILHNCPTKYILDWIKQDKALFSTLSGKICEGRFKLQFAWGKAEVRTSIINKISSYIYWKFRTTPWIEVGEKRYTITDCILASFGTSLAPFLVEPDIDEYIKSYKSNKVEAKKKIEDIFELLGIKNEFSDLNIAKIYEILNALPQLNIEERIIKNIYESLTKSNIFLSKNDTQHESLVNFFNNGVVLCTNGKFVSIKKSHYLSRRNICKKILERFNLVAIRPRMSSTKIKELLGVKKLEVKFTLENYTFYPDLENQEFQSDFKNYIPIAFCYRKEHAKEAEKSKFRNLKIKLCTELSIKYSKNSFPLDDYEYVSKKSEFFLKVPQRKFIDLQQDMDFAEAVASILCSHIDVDEPHINFRALYKNSQNDREKFLLQDYPDKDFYEDSKKTIWGNMLASKDTFVNILSKLSKKGKREIKAILPEIDYINLSNIENCDKLIVLFKKLNIGIDKYNELETQHYLDLTEHYTNKIEVLKTKYKKFYSKKIYDELKNDSLAKKTNFVDKLLNYDQAKIKIENSVWFEFEEEFFNYFQLKGVKKNTRFDLNKIYNNNFEKWKNLLSKLNLDDSLINDFLSNNEMTSLIYFGEFSELSKKYKSFVVNILPNSIQHNDEEMVSQSKESTKVATVIPVTTTGIIETVPPTAPSTSTVGYKRSKNDHTKQNTGFEGEQLVYGYLLTHEDISNVEWVSENAKTAAINPLGTANKGYDLEYIDKKGIKKFVEVKASQGREISFYLSANEWKFARENFQNYLVYFVAEINTLMPKIYIFDNLFNEDGTFNEQNFTCDIQKYMIRASIKKTDN